MGAGDEKIDSDGIRLFSGGGEINIRDYSSDPEFLHYAT